MSKIAFALAIPVDHYNHPFKALVESTMNMAALVCDFMYGTPQRANLTYLFAIGVTALGLGMDHAHSMAILQGCPVSSL